MSRCVRVDTSVSYLDELYLNHVSCVGHCGSERQAVLLPRRSSRIKGVEEFSYRGEYPELVRRWRLVVLADDC